MSEDVYTRVARAGAEWYHDQNSKPAAEFLLTALLVAHIQDPETFPRSYVKQYSKAIRRITDD